jgi:hypothetical protein
VAVNLDITSQTTYGDAAGLKGFSLAHRIAHQDNAQMIAAAGHGSVPGFDVGDEVAMKEWGVLMSGLENAPKSPSPHMKEWLQLHDMIHKAEYNALNIGTGPDLAEVNFANKDEFDQWMLDHQQAHDAVGSALGSTT